MRSPGSRDGLTRPEAERRLRRAMDTSMPPSVTGSITVTPACEHHIKALRVLGRRETTIEDYRCLLRRHIVPAFGNSSIERVSADEISALVASMLGRGFAVSTTHHVLNLLNGTFRRAVRRGQVTANAVALVCVPPPRARTPTSAT